MRFFKQKNGAISVFLVMILVPCMMVSSLFVDIGRVHLSKGMANSSADLALNTLMTRYDADLKEFYGLAASCQSIDEFYSMSVDYFTRTMTSQGLTEEEVDLMVDEFKLAFTDLANRNPSDLLDVEVLEANVSSALDTSNMANPTFIKDGVIEFMKYRAPIGIAERGILTFLGGNETKQKLENNNAEKELTKKKNEYYKSSKNFYTTAKDIYLKLKAYTEKGYTTDKIDDLLSTVNGYKSIYQEIHKALVFDLMNTEGLASVNRPLYDDSNPSFKVYTYYDYGLPNPNLATENDVKALIKSLISAMASFNSAKGTLENSFIEYKSGTGEDSSYDIQYWLKCSKSISSALYSFDQSMKELMKARNALQNALDYLYVTDYSNIYGEGSHPTWKITDGQYSMYSKFSQELSTEEHIEAVVAQYDSFYSTYVCTLTRDEASTDKYIKYMSILERISNDEANKKKISASTNILSNGKSVEANIKDINTEINSIRQGFVDRKTELETINTLLDDLEGLRSTRITNFVDWESAADNLDEKSEMAQEDMDAINKGEPDKLVAPEKDIVDEVTSEDITNMKNRISGMISLYDALINIIDAQKYGGKEIKNLKLVSDVKNASGIDVTEINKNDYISNKSLNKYVNDTFSYAGGDATIDYTDINHPSITHSPVPSLYTWMVSKHWDKDVENKVTCSICGNEFDSTIYGEVVNKEAELENIKDDSGTGEENKTIDKVDTSVCPKCQYGNKSEEEDEEESNPEPDSDAAGSSNAEHDIKGTKAADKFPSNFNTSGVSLFDNIGGVLSTIGKLFTDTGDTAETARDALYTTEYIFGMFSHQAYEGEAKFQIMLDNAGNGDIPRRDELEKIGPSSFKTKCNNSKVEEIFNSDDPEIRYNKSLTNKKICKEYNYAYGAEIEYILKAGTNDDNYRDVYGNIYAIRYLTNTPAGFATFWKVPTDMPNNVNKSEILAKAALYQSIAAAVSAATCGIIPEPLTKGVLILIEIALETVLDMEYLKAGLPVRFIKSKCDENWGFTRTIGIENKTDKSGNVVGAKVELGYVSYSDYLYVFVITGLLNLDSLDGIYKRIGDVIQANMQTILSFEDYQLSKAVTHFKFTAKLKVNPLMINLPIFDEFDNQLDTKDDWCTYDVDIVRGY